MGTQKLATLILLDVNNCMLKCTDNGETYFKRSINCIKRIIARKIFSTDNDEISLLLFGSDTTDNPLATDEHYTHISIASNLTLPSWELYRKVDEIKVSNDFYCDWTEAVIVGLDFIKNATMGRRFKTTQFIVFSNCDCDSKSNSDSISYISNILEGEKVQFIVVGRDVENECSQGLELPESMNFMFEMVSKLDSGVHLSFSEIEKDLMFYDKKKKMLRLYKVNFTIGSQIQIPVRWFKCTIDETRLKWELPLRHEMPKAETVVKTETMMKPETMIKTETSVPNAFVPSHPPSYEITHTEVRYAIDMSKTVFFGATPVDLSYADLDALGRQTGPASLMYIGSIKSKKISRNMFVGSDIYLIVADKHARSVAMFSAFVEALISANRFAIARRIAMKNGKVAVGALVPISDDIGKGLYFLKLPFKEWVKKVPEKILPEPSNSEALDAMDELIESAMLPDDLHEEGKGIQVRDPAFQHRCEFIESRVTGKLSKDLFLAPSDKVMNILRPLDIEKRAGDALKKLEELFPYTPPPEKAAKNNKNEPRVPAPIIKKEDKEEVKELLGFIKDNFDEAFSDDKDIFS